jgi:ADP-heptose:LPS heptosyltransferase
MKILVIQQKMIGDVLVSSILCENLRLAYPNAQIDYLIYDSTKSVIDGANYISNLILFTKKERKSKLALLKFGLQLRKTKYDVIIDAYSKLESWILVALSGATKKISFEKSTSGLFYTNTIKRHSDYNSNLGLIIEQRLALLEPLEIEKKITFPSIIVSETEKNTADSIFAKNKIDSSKKTVMFSSIGSDKTKTYPLPYMAEIIDYVADNYNVNILFNYIPNQIKEAKKVLDLCKKSTQEKVYFNVIGGSIREFIALMDKCEIIIGNDGGATNMAKALNKPSFILFCPWIDKKGWAILEDGKKHISFHLDEFLPSLFENKKTKEVKEKYIEFYNEFKPQLFLKNLNHFLKDHIG